MPPSTRLLGPLEAASSQTSGALYVCSTCRRQFRPQCFRLANQQFRRHQSNKGDIPFTEKVRRKLWGTDNPPGLKDPYGGEGKIERAWRLRKEAKEGKKPQPEEEEPEKTPEQQSQLFHVEKEPPKEYEPATTWDGLEHVGSLGKWDDAPATEQDEFTTGFMARNMLTTRDDIVTALHQVMVELLITKEVNRPLDTICCIPTHEASILMHLNQTGIKPSEDSSTGILTYPSEAAKEELLEFFSSIEAESAAGEEVEAAAEAEEEYYPDEEGIEEEGSTLEINVPTNLDFLSISLQDPEFKFAFLKRTAQITGHRILDPEIQKMTRLSNLYRYLLDASKPKPAKLAERLQEDGRLLGLPNVKIYNRRQTPIDKEKEVGRWKVIEEELVARGLPVTGHTLPKQE